MTVLLRFATSNTFGSAIIRAATWDWCSHVGFKLEDGSLLDATQHCGVSIRRLDDQPFMRASYYRFVGDQAVVDRAVAWARTQVGRPYDWTGILGLGIRDRNWHEDDSWFCSELVAEAFEQAGTPLLDGTDAYRITPRDVRISPLLAPV